MASMDAIRDGTRAGFPLASPLDLQTAMASNASETKRPPRAGLP